MTPKELLSGLLSSLQASPAFELLREFEHQHGTSVSWTPVGDKKNNSGVIEVSSDPGRSIVERVTNGIDAIIEFEHGSHGGQPSCRSPREACSAWLNIPTVGLAAMSPGQRRNISKRLTVTLKPGDGPSNRIIEVSDDGLGILPESLSSTILSLNEDNKIEKFYLAGRYGQGGSSTFAFSRIVVVASKHSTSNQIGFTIVRYEELPPDRFKSGRYVFLLLDGRVPTIDFDPGLMAEHGTKCCHVGYDLSQYKSPIGAASVYGLLQYVLFDPVLPIWFDNQVDGWRRVIKGSRNALNGAQDDNDDETKLSHRTSMFFSEIGDFGRIGIEYWVLPMPETKKIPIAAFVNPMRPIILTLNGQNQAELSQTLVRRKCELPFLVSRLICHVNCESLNPSALRALFASTREDVRKTAVFQRIEDEVVKALRSDDELKRLNDEARDALRQQDDVNVTSTIKREVANLLRLQGFPIPGSSRPEQSPEGGGVGPSPPPPGPPRPRPPLPTITIQEPPTYIRFVTTPEHPINFHPTQRRYIRIETDAESTYHDPRNPNASRINLIVNDAGFSIAGTTPLNGGRMRTIVDCMGTAQVGHVATIRVELSRRGLPTLSDERTLTVVQDQSNRPGPTPQSLPMFDVREVSGPDHQLWTTLEWPEDITKVASSAQLESGTLVVYFSTVFPKYAAQLHALEHLGEGVVNSFKTRYKIWLAVHSLIYFQDQQATPPTDLVVDESFDAERERNERCRIAIMSVLIAARETQEYSASQGRTSDV